MSDITCEFKDICKSIYPEPIVDYCMLQNKSHKICRLVLSIQKGKVSNFVLDLIGKFTDKSKDKLFGVACPRSSTSVSINKPCSLKTCPYFANRMSYNCMLIHKDIFFYDNNELPSKLMEIASGINAQEFNRIVELGIYQSRIVILLLNYHKDTIENICPICSCLNLYNAMCQCLQDKELRRKRINFSSNWQKALSNDLFEKFDLKECSVKTISEFYDIFSMEFVRAWINYPIVTTKLSDLPFGYVFCTFFKLFNNSLSSSMENLGLNEKLFKKSLVLFPIGGHL